MGNFTRPFLLLSTIMAIMMMSFKAESINKYSPTAACKPFSFANSSFPDTLAHVISTDAISAKTLLDNETAFDQEKSRFKNKQLKFRKKFKRLPQGLTGFRPPVKNVESARFNLFSISTYNKPYFLSHLHYFLFRLTPF
jgi:hypothetical protein